MKLDSLYKDIIAVYKPIAITPLQLVQQFKQKFPEYKDTKIGYAGRLDPMAHGVMLLLIGNENKNRDQYLNLNKTYQFTVLFGISTDSYDILGILSNTKYCHPDNTLAITITAFINDKLGKQTQQYPPYSSKTFKGKPLFQWAREGRLSEVKFPNREVEIFNFNLIELQVISAKALSKIILENITKIEGDFRQEEISDKWNSFFQAQGKTTFITAKFQIDCSSGTYVRSLIHELGKLLGCGAIALDIYRTKVGEFGVGEIR